MRPSFKRGGFRPTRKRIRRVAGIRPSYLGWHPRSFALGEKKYHDVSLDGITMDSTGYVRLLNGLSLGNSATTRVGMRIQIASIEIRLIMMNNQAATNNGRLSIVIDKQANAAAPTVANVYTAAGISYPRNLAYRKRFRVIFDKTWIFSADNVDQNSDKFFHKFIRFRRPLAVEYNAADNGDIQDISSNSIHTISSGITATPNGPACYGVARIRFYDA